MKKECYMDNTVLPSCVDGCGGELSCDDSVIINTGMEVNVDIPIFPDPSPKCCAAYLCEEMEKNRRRSYLGKL